MTKYNAEPITKAGVHCSWHLGEAQRNYNQSSKTWSMLNLVWLILNLENISRASRKYDRLLVKSLKIRTKYNNMRSTRSTFWAKSETVIWYHEAALVSAEHQRERQCFVVEIKVRQATEKNAEDFEYSS